MVKYLDLDQTDRAFVKRVVTIRGNSNTITRKELSKLESEYNLTVPKWVLSKENRIERGVYSLALDDSPYAKSSVGIIEGKEYHAVDEAEGLLAIDPELRDVEVIKHDVIHQIDEDQGYVPAINKSFIPGKNFEVIREIIRSGQPLPIWLSGPTGAGKTADVKQACALEGRELFTVSVVNDSTSEDFIGGPQIRDGETVWQHGPAVLAAMRGGILLLDELDQADTPVMVLQALLNGDPFAIKKTNQMVHPQPGFLPIATGNTKGSGDMSGYHIGAKVQNYAFLARFAVTLEYGYPTYAEQIKILNSFIANEPKFSELGFDPTSDKEVRHLISDTAYWAESIRKLALDGGIDHSVSIRDTLNLMRMFSAFGTEDPKTVIRYLVSRYDEDTIESFTEQWSLISGRSAEEEKRLQAELSGEKPKKKASKKTKKTDEKEYEINGKKFTVF